jgi:hypothetical protein
MRAKNLSAHAAYTIALPPEQITFPWEPVERDMATIKKARFRQGDFDCLLKLHMDFDYRFTECRGEFTGTWKPGVIDYPPARHDRSLPRYFLPEISVEEHRDDLEKQGYSRGVAEELARQYVREDMLIAADPESRGYAAYGVTAQIFWRGVEVAYAGLWGIETADRKYDEDPYLDECANSVLHDALKDARKKVAELQA